MAAAEQVGTEKEQTAGKGSFFKGRVIFELTLEGGRLPGRHTGRKETARASLKEGRLEKM